MSEAAYTKKLKTSLSEYASDEDISVLSELLQLLETYLPPEDIQEVIRAYEFGARAHEGQQRISGEPYIHHPVAVARILADLRMDYQSIVAAILHDVIEDTPTAEDQIADEFGQPIAALVDGVSKLDQIHFDTKAEAAAASFRKMILAMVNDIRVIMIKLADRMHNMRTLGVMPPEKRRRIARETLDVYVPIAVRLGINTLRVELQELGFKSLYPMRYRVLNEEVKKSRGNRKEIMHKVEITISARMEKENIPAKITAREKTLHSVYNKMRTKGLHYHEIMDLFALRIVANSVDECYRSLGVVHNIYKPVPGLFKDYIAIPKANGYQALHTTMFGPHGIPIEVQIRTEEMDQFAESGIAAHWIYKTGEKPSVSAHSRINQWLQDLLEIQQKAGNPIEFLENVKIDLFPDEVYVFTPNGQILELPQGCTPVDFAYAVHTDVGNHCMSAKIDRRMAPLSTKLENGQTVEIITSPVAHPNPAWLNFVATAKARGSIRHYLKHLTSDDAVRLGKRLLNQALSAFSLSIKDIPELTLNAMLEEYAYKDLNELLQEIGLGNRMPKLVARRIAPGESTTEKHAKIIAAADTTSIKPLAIKGTEGLAVSYGRCCHPIPGDQILGFMSAGRGIVIHRKLCKNIREYLDSPEKWLDVEWSENVDTVLPVTIRVDVTNSRGVLAQLATAISEGGCNIESVEHEDKDGVVSAVYFVISVTDRKMLANLMRRIRRIKPVLKVTRVRG